MQTVYRMENSKHYGPFSPDAAYDGGRSFEDAYAVTKDMWQNVPWIEVDGLGMTTRDDVDPDEYPNHFKDVLGLSDDETMMAELLHLPLINGDWAVGCESLQQFQHWFPPQSFADFERHGMRLDVYNVPDSYVRKGKWQVMFERDKAKLVKTEKLSQLAKEEITSWDTH